MRKLEERISEALAREEARAERFASFVRLILLGLLTAVALLNVGSVSRDANLLNFGAIVASSTYGLVVFVLIRRAGYHPWMKYITSCLDILLVFVLLFMYTRIEIPSVALKNYVFLIVFPLLTLTAFRYDRTLTLVAGSLALALYLLLIGFLDAAGLITFARGGYERELFSSDVTYVGQITKLLILGGYVVLLSYLAQYSRKLFTQLVREELSLRNQKEQTDWELTLASQVQMRLLPHEFPEIDGLDLFGAVQQGRSVGGDYCDFIRRSDETLLIVVADVSGKGVPAALIMAEVRAATQLLAGMECGLADLAGRLNALVHDSTDKKSFVTFFAAEVDVSRRRLTYVNAGHPLPLIQRGGTMHALNKGTIPLGVRAVLPALNVHTEEFPPGSLLVAFTDGLPEQTNPQGDQFGEDRLREYMRTHLHADAATFGRGVLAELGAYAGPGEAHDDISITVVKHTERLQPRTP